MGHLVASSDRSIVLMAWYFAHLPGFVSCSRLARIVTATQLVLDASWAWASIATPRPEKKSLVRHQPAVAFSIAQNF